MTRRIVQVGTRRILFSPLDPPPIANRWQALVKIRAVDEMTVSQPLNPVTLDVADKEMIPVISGDAFGGLVGIPKRSFPDLVNQFYDVEVVVGARGYLSRRLTVRVDQDPTFPNTFTPADHSVPPKGPVELHREPTMISGRTVRFISGKSTPVAGASISLTEIQRTPTSVAIPPNVVVFAPPIYEDRAALVHFVRRRDVAVIGSNKSLVDDVAEADNSIRLSDRLGLIVGDLIRIDGTDPELTEIIAIANFDSAIPPDQPSAIELDYPVARSHRSGTVVSQLNPLAPGAQQQLTVSADAGDTCVFLDGVAALSGASVVEVTGPTKSEYHQVTSFDMVSDGDGYFRLPGLSRVAQLKILAEKLIGAQLFATTTSFRPDYQQPENRLDLVLEPP